MPVIGTAGHVDHGKSTLVKALTGRDPDRFKEEKDRGLTIDLGFAWAELGQSVSFVDVPGHVRFMKNMLAGIEAIDIALLVVAADEGWMPQSEEHLAVIDLLDVKRGVVALTKADRVDEDLLGLARLEIDEHLARSSLDGVAVTEVSAITGRGMDELRAELSRLVGGLAPPPNGSARLWIDRSFSVAGAGTVVTGTLLGGSVAVDDHLTLFPNRREVRVRSIQSHEQHLEQVEAGRRVALNLGGVQHAEVARGAMLGTPGRFTTTSRFSASVRPARHIETIAKRGAYHIHVGSGAWPVQVRFPSEDVAIIDLPIPLPLVSGDRFILRESGRRMVMAGGVVLDLHPPRRPGDATELARSLAHLGSPEETALALLTARGRWPIDILEAETGAQGLEVSLFDGVAFHPDEIARLALRANQIVAEFHRNHPTRPGIPGARLASELGLGSGLLERVATTAGLVIDGTEVRSGDHQVGLSDDQERLWSAIRQTLDSAGAAALPRISDLELSGDLLHLLIREQRLARISDEFVMLPEQIEALKATMMDLGERFTVAEFRDATGLSRKYAVPFLEWSDRIGVTIRMGDTRRVRSG